MENAKKLQSINNLSEFSDDNKGDLVFEQNSKLSVESQYNIISLLTLSIVLLFACVFFFAVSDGNYTDDSDLSFSWKSLVSGKYTESLEEHYNKSIPYPDTMKALSQHFAFFYGIGNKADIPLFSKDQNNDKGDIWESIVSQNKHNRENDNNRKENIITTARRDPYGRTITTTTKKKSTTTTTAKAIAKNSTTTTETTTTSKKATTNNDAPEVTATQTEQYVPETTTTPQSDTQAPPTEPPHSDTSAPDTSDSGSETTTTPNPNSPEVIPD